MLLGPLLSAVWLAGWLGAAQASFRVPIQPVDLSVRDWRNVQGDGFGLKLNNFGDTIYYGHVVVGTPPQEARVVFDTGSTQFWLMAAGCRVQSRRGAPCRGKRLFHKRRSRTFRPRAGRFSQLYDVGYAYGDMGQDTVGIGTIKEHSLLTPNVTFGLATVIDKASNDDIIDGIMGLGFPVRGEPESLINRAVASKTLEKPLYTVWMEKVGGEVDRVGGEILFGDLDRVHCEPQVHFVKVTDTHYWQFTVDRVGALRGGGGLNLVAENVQVISDTGTSVIVLPWGHFKKMLRALNLKDSAPGLPYVPCNLRFQVDIYINGTNYPLSAQDLLVRYSDGCVLQLDRSSVEDDDTWILGDPFIRTYCQVYDLGRKQIGFARARTPQPRRVPSCGRRCASGGRKRRMRHREGADQPRPLGAGDAGLQPADGSGADGLDWEPADGLDRGSGWTGPADSAADEPSLWECADCDTYEKVGLAADFGRGEYAGDGQFCADCGSYLANNVSSDNRLAN